MSQDDDLALSLVRGDALLRAQRAIGLVPREGLGAGRRALVLALFTWAPIAFWAFLEGRALPGAVDEPLLRHFGIHVRCLVAIPLFVIAEAVAHGVSTRLLPHFVASGLVSEAELPRFREVLRGVARLRDASLPWVAIAALVIGWMVLSPDASGTHELVWDADAAHQGFGFGALWFRWVLRPIFMVLLLAWLWRVILVFVLCLRLSRLELALVPTHPDGAGGLGFLEGLPSAFSPVVLGMAAVLSSQFAHDVLYHEVHVPSLRMPMIAFGVVALLLFLSPLLPWMRLLRASKRRAELEYGSLVARHGREVRRRWIEGAQVDAADDALLAAPEIGPVADTLTLYEAVRKMRTLPIGRRSLLAILVPVALPFLIVVGLEIPVKDLLLKLLNTLV